MLSLALSLVSFLLSLSRGTHPPILPDSHLTADHRYSLAQPTSCRDSAIGKLCPGFNNSFRPTTTMIHIPCPLLVGETPKVINNCESTQSLDRGET
ncbi:hypothetical protein BC826DRAFT_1043505 [Russula brevipes]|nr:hypothetical protein BC826DRAFT_1043505 [Russula brevipes]